METNLIKIDGYENYSFIDMRSVYSHPRKQMLLDRCGKTISRDVNGKILSGTMKDGYLHFSLTKCGKEHSVPFHRLLAKQFIQNPENKPHINHKNGIKTDNRLENLEWCTVQENNLHANRAGLLKKSLTQEEAREIRKEYIPKKHGSIRALATKYAVSKTVIQNIVSGKTYKEDSEIWSEIRRWTVLINADLNVFEDIEHQIRLLEGLGSNLKTHLIDNTGIFAYIIIDDFLGQKCLCEIMFYIRRGFRGNVRLLKRYITEIEKIAIDNNCKTVKIGSNIGYKDESFIRVLKRWGYSDDTVSKGL